MAMLALRTFHTQRNTRNVRNDRFYPRVGSTVASAVFVASRKYARSGLALRPLLALQWMKTRLYGDDRPTDQSPSVTY